MVAGFFDQNRIEPRPADTDLQEGIAAVIHDPLWFLARQWRMGEFQGENASSPVWIEYTLRSARIEHSDSRFDPRNVPAEVVVESELDDWWTMGRRIRIGRLLSASPVVEAIDFEGTRFADPPPPYDRFKGAFDGLLLWKRLIDEGIDPASIAGVIPPDSVPAWSSDELLYEQQEPQSFQTEDRALIVKRHRGGRLDWYGVEATASDGNTAVVEKAREALPVALQYPGAPNSRYWEFEHAEIDPSLYAPDSAHTATAMLTELIFSHSDDWFLFPVLAEAGHKVTIEGLVVTDSFGRGYSSFELLETGAPLWEGLQTPEDWTLFQVDGLEARDRLLWNVAEFPLESLPIERVLFGADEESNLVWAVEHIIDGRGVVKSSETRPDADESPPFNDGMPSGDTTKQREYAYVPARGVAPRWHPYKIDPEGDDHRFKQYRMADLTRQRPGLLPAAEAAVLQPPPGAERHELAPRALPSNGVQVERRWKLARSVDGQPLLWIERRRQAALSPPARRLRFDVMEERIDSSD
jgi:hypothetical protein